MILYHGTNLDFAEIDLKKKFRDYLLLALNSRSLLRMLL